MKILIHNTNISLFRQGPVVENTEVKVVEGVKEVEMTSNTSFFNAFAAPTVPALNLKPKEKMEAAVASLSAVNATLDAVVDTASVAKEDASESQSGLEDDVSPRSAAILERNALKLNRLRSLPTSFIDS